MKKKPKAQTPAQIRWGIGKPFNCKRCEKELIKKSYQHSYCFDCLKIKKSESDKRYRERGDHLVTKICKSCGNEYKRLRKEVGRYCGRQCYYDDYKNIRSGKKHPCYKHGLRTGKKKPKYDRDRLPEIKGRKLKQEMVDTVGHVYCQHCKTSNALAWEYHHIVYRSEAPRHENLHEDRNLIMLCIKCHNWFHSQKDRREYLIKERKLWELFPEHITRN